MESVTGVETLKSMAVEPQMQRRWEEQLAGYVGASFKVVSLGNTASQCVQLVNKLVIAGTLYYGAKLVIGGSLSVVAVAFVTVMIFWMRKASRSIAAELRGQLDHALDVGALAVLLLSFLAVGREGLETAVFFWAAAQATGETSQPLVGFLIGIVVAAVVTPGDALCAGVTFPYTATVQMGSGLATLVTGQVPGGLLGPNGLTGAVGISYITYAYANQGVFYWLQLAAFFSMALGLANLLPLPALDGGRIVVVLAEKLRGRPFDREREMAIQRAGLVALFALMIFIAFLDVQRIATGQFAGLK